MIAIAEQKNLYDELAVADASQYLNQHKNEYDLIVAADVLVLFRGITNAIVRCLSILN